MLMNKCSSFSGPEISFAAQIDELHQKITRLDHELSEWKKRTTTESEKRRTAENEIIQLKITNQQFQTYNKRLEMHVKEWKLMTEKSRNKAVENCREVSKIFAALEAKMDISGPQS